MTFKEWWESYLNSEPSDKLLRDKEFAKFVWESVQPKWEPIKTAPKNGAMFLGYVPHSNGGYICCFYWNNKLKQWQNNIDGGCDMPTHWMPLPEPPKELAS